MLPSDRTNSTRQHMDSQVLQHFPQLNKKMESPISSESSSPRYCVTPVSRFKNHYNPQTSGTKRSTSSTPYFMRNIGSTIKGTPGTKNREFTKPRNYTPFRDLHPEQHPAEHSITEFAYHSDGDSPESLVESAEVVTPETAAKMTSNPLLFSELPSATKSARKLRAIDVALFNDSPSAPTTTHDVHVIEEEGKEIICSSRNHDSHTGKTLANTVPHKDGPQTSSIMGQWNTVVEVLSELVGTSTTGYRNKKTHTKVTKWQRMQVYTFFLTSLLVIILGCKIATTPAKPTVGKQFSTAHLPPHVKGNYRHTVQIAVSGKGAVHVYHPQNSQSKNHELVKVNAQGHIVAALALVTFTGMELITDIRYHSSRMLVALRERAHEAGSTFQDNMRFFKHVVGHGVLSLKHDLVGTEYMVDNQLCLESYYDL